MSCTLCHHAQSFAETYNQNCMQGIGATCETSQQPRLMFVGECVTEDDAKQKKPFGGYEGQVIADMIQRLGLDMAQHYYTKAIKCLPAGNRIKTTDGRKCGTHLLSEINIVKPAYIFAMGNVAAKALGVKENYFAAQRNLHAAALTFVPVYVTMGILTEAVTSNTQYQRFFDQLQYGLELMRGGAEPTRLNFYQGYYICKTPQEAEQAVDYALSSELFTYDFEATGLDYYDTQKPASMTCMGLCAEQGRSIIIPTLAEDYAQPDLALPRVFQAVKKALSSEALVCNPDGTPAAGYRAPKKVAHNFKFDSGFALYRYGIETNAVWLDTMLAAFQLDENTPNDLHNCTYMYLPEMAGYDNLMEEKYHSPAVARGNDLWWYNGGDTDATYRLAKLFEPMLREEDQLWLHQELLVPVSMAYIRMEHRGMKFNLAHMEKLEREYWAIIDKLHAELYATPQVIEYEKREHKEFRPTSGMDVKKLLLDYCGMPILSVSDITQEASVGKKELKAYSKKHKNDVAGLLLEIRKYDKALTTYLTGMRSKIYQDGIAHTNFNVIGARTGRLSSGGGCTVKEDPLDDFVLIDVDPSARRTINLQNIPHDNTDLRNIVCAREGYYLLSRDFSQAEVAIAAAITGDVVLMDLYMDATRDLHRAMASEAFGIPYGEVTDEVRGHSKSITFGVMYGRGAASIAEQIGKTKEEAQRLIDAFFSKFTGLRDGFEEFKKMVDVYGMVTTPLGRRRRFPIIDAGSYRQAVNMPIQGTASDMTELGVVRLMDLCRRNKLEDRVFPISTVHDEIVIETKFGYVKTAVDLSTDALEQYIYTLPRVQSFIKKIRLRTDVEITALNGGWGSIYNINSLAIDPDQVIFTGADDQLIKKAA